MVTGGMFTAMASVLSDAYDISQNQNEWKERIKKEWEESKKLPRKKKKQKRKELLVDWNIANWDPFNL